MKYLKFIFHRLSQNLITKILAIISALVLMVIFNSRYYTTINYDVPIRIISNANIKPIQEMPRSIPVSISGKKISFDDTFDLRNVEAYVDLRGETDLSKSNFTVFLTAESEAYLRSFDFTWNLKGNVLRLELDYFSKILLPINLKFKETVPEGYKLLRYAITPEAVTIVGRRKMLGEITEINTEELDWNTFRQSQSIELPLDLSEIAYYSISDNTVSLDMEIEELRSIIEFKDRAIRVLGLPNDLNYNQTSLSVNSVILEGKTSILKNMVAEDLIFYITYNEESGGGFGRFKNKNYRIRMNPLPEGVNLINYSPQTVDLVVYENKN